MSFLNLEKSHILFISGVGGSVDDVQLESLFQEHDGFKEVRRVPGKPELAFVEYDSVKNAKIAKDVLDGFEITSGNNIKIEFSKN